MELDLGQIKEITVGAQCVSLREDGGFSFQRFTAEQLAYYASFPYEISFRTECSAGCRLDFYTNSNRLFFQTLSSGKYELLVNGLSTKLIDGQECIAVALPDAPCRVTLLLPSYRQGGLKNVQLDEHSWVKPCSYRHAFLFFGDSITQGSTASRPSCTYVNRISRWFDAKVLNLGVGGTCFDEKALAIPNYDPDVVFVAFGTNDYNTYDTLDEIEQHCNAYLDKVKEYFPRKKVICISPLWRADGELMLSTGTLADVKERIEAQIKQHDFFCVDGYTLVPHMTEFYADGFLHPNDLGFSYYSENLIYQISSILQE